MSAEIFFRGLDEKERKVPVKGIICLYPAYQYENKPLHMIAIQDKQALQLLREYEGPLMDIMIINFLSDGNKTQITKANYDECHHVLFLDGSNLNGIYQNSREEIRMIEWPHETIFYPSC